MRGECYNNTYEPWEVEWSVQQLKSQLYDAKICQSRSAELIQLLQKLVRVMKPWVCVDKLWKLTRRSYQSTNPLEQAWKFRNYRAHHGNIFQVRYNARVCFLHVVLKHMETWFLMERPLKFANPESHLIIYQMRVSLWSSLCAFLTPYCPFRTTAYCLNVDCHNDGRS